MYVHINCTDHVQSGRRKFLFLFSYRVACGFPDMRSCILNQKLQMLNVCMERKNIREGKLPFAMQLLSQQEGKTDSDDEFFDCDDDRVVDDEGMY